MEPIRCRRCYYILHGLEFARCPECGLPFDPGDPSTFVVGEMFLRWRYWVPGLGLAVGGGLFLYAVLVPAVGWGVAATLAAPFVVGAIVGYGARVGPWLSLVVLGLATGGVILGLMTAGLAGTFCATVLLAIVGAPALVGWVAGLMLRGILKESGFSQRRYLPALLMSMPLLIGAVEGRRTYALETITTMRFIAADGRRTWEAMMFYEEVRHRPPLLLRTVLARPVRTTGRASAVGDRKTCQYTRGRLVKEVTRIEREKAMAFRVIEHVQLQDHAVALEGGRFGFEPLRDGTQVALETEYRPKLGPRWAWRPFERWAVHTLHDHVLEGMRREAEGDGDRAD